MLRTQGIPQDGAGGAPDDGEALDLAHLARQCMGDRDLEAEVLRQFRTEAPALAASLAQDRRSSLAAKADLAHRLKGSALAVGAWRIAHAAAVVEACGRAGAQAGPQASQAVELSQAIAALSAAVAEAMAEIDRLHG